MKRHKALQRHRRAFYQIDITATDAHKHARPHALYFFVFFITAPVLPFESWRGWEHSFSKLLNSKTQCWSERETSHCAQSRERQESKRSQEKWMRLNPPSAKDGQRTREYHAISLHIFHFNLQTLQYLPLMGVLKSSRLVRNLHSDLLFGGCKCVPECPESETRSCRKRLNVKPKWLTGNIDTLVHGYINILVCNWCNLMDCMSVRGFAGAILSVRKVLITICDGQRVSALLEERKHVRRNLAAFGLMWSKARGSCCALCSAATLWAGISHVTLFGALASEAGKSFPLNWLFSRPTNNWK